MRDCLPTKNIQLRFDITADGSICPRCGNEFNPAWSNGYCTDCDYDVDGVSEGMLVDEDDIRAYIDHLNEYNLKLEELHTVLG